MQLVFSLINTYGLVAVMFIALGVLTVLKKMSRLLCSAIWFGAGFLFAMAIMKGIIQWPL